MKLLQINSTVNFGSTGRIAENIGRYVISQGGTSYIAHGRKSNGSESNLIKVGNKFDQSAHVINTRLFDTHGFHSTAATQNLVQKIVEIDPDIIQLHNLHGYYLDVKVLFEFLNTWKKPVFWTLHDCWAFTGHCCYYERVNCEKWKTSCHHCPLIHLYPQSFSDNSEKNYIEKRRLFNLPSNLQLITVSKWLESQVNKSFLKSKKVTTIYNGLDLTVMRPKDQEKLKCQYGYADKKIILGVANIWSEGKGLSSFLELSKRIPDDQLIILVGLSKVQVSSLPSNIIGLEKTADMEELSDYYSLADVFVSPSKAETFGLVIAEAMASGTPSIVYDSSAMPELISNETGKVVPVDSFDALNEAVQAILNEGKENYAAQCRLRAENLFNINEQYKRYTALYNDNL